MSARDGMEVAKQRYLMQDGFDGKYIHLTCSNNIALFLANDFYFNFFQNLNQKKFLAADFCVNFNRI